MRTFYIFKIKKPYAILTRNNPLPLYKTIEHIYYLKENELKKHNNIFNQLKDTFNQENLNNLIYFNYKNNYNYIKFNNTHIINDYYTKEKTKMIVNKNYILIKTTKDIPSFLNILSNKDNIFICDFNNKDFFWSNTIYKRLV